MKEIKEMTVEEMIETLDHFYMDDCLIKQFVDSSFISTMIDRLRDEFNIFYHPRIKVEKTQFGTRYKVVPQHEKLDQAYKNACESFKKELTQILGLCEYESNSMVIDKVKTNQKLLESYEDILRRCQGLVKDNDVFRSESSSDNERLKNKTNVLVSTVVTLQEKIRSLEESGNSNQKRIHELITKCNELIEENKNLKKIYKNSIEKQYRLETDNAELLRKVKIQDDSEEVILNWKKKQEETERLLHESVAMVNEECQACVNAERKQIKETILKHIEHEYPIIYFNYKYRLLEYSIEDIVKLIMRGI